MNIRPSADLRNHYKEISNLAKKTKEPVHITVNGKNDVTLIASDEYDLLCETIQLMKDISEGLSDIAAGDTCTIDDIKKDLKL